MSDPVYVVFRNESQCCYGTDVDGNPWSTFSFTGSDIKCGGCGKTIHSGWCRGRMGDNLQLFVCSEHVLVTDDPHKEDKKRTKQRTALLAGIIQMEYHLSQIHQLRLALHTPYPGIIRESDFENAGNSLSEAGSYLEELKKVVRDSNIDWSET